MYIKMQNYAEAILFIHFFDISRGQMLTNVKIFVMFAFVLYQQSKNYGIIKQVCHYYQS